MEGRGDEALNLVAERPPCVLALPRLLLFDGHCEGKHSDFPSHHRELMVLEDHFLTKLRSFFFLMGNQLQGVPCVFLSHALMQQILWIVSHLDHEIVHDSGKKLHFSKCNPL